MKTTNETTFTKTMKETFEALSTMWDDTVNVSAAATIAVAQTGSLTARATHIAIDTYNYGVKQALTHAPKSGEEVVDMFSAFMTTEKPAFVGPVQQH